MMLFYNFLVGKENFSIESQFMDSILIKLIKISKQLLKIHELFKVILIRTLEAKKSKSLTNVIINY